MWWWGFTRLWRRLRGSQRRGSRVGDEAFRPPRASCRSASPSSGGRLSRTPFEGRASCVARRWRLSRRNTRPGPARTKGVDGSAGRRGRQVHAGGGGESARRRRTARRWDWVGRLSATHLVALLALLDQHQGEAWAARGDLQRAIGSDSRGDARLEVRSARVPAERSEFSFPPRAQLPGELLRQQKIARTSFFRGPGHGFASSALTRPRGTSTGAASPARPAGWRPRTRRIRVCSPATPRVRTRALASRVKMATTAVPGRNTPSETPVA